MAFRQRIEQGIRVGLVLSVLGGACAKPNQYDDPNLIEPSTTVTAQPPNEVMTDPTIDPPVSTAEPTASQAWPTQTPWVTEFPTQFSTLIPTMIPTLEPKPTELENPWKGHVFNQRCTLTGKYGADGRPEFNCVEPWAALPLPAGCSNEFHNYEGASSCNATAVTYVLNALVSPEKFMQVIGQPGITPDFLIDNVYPHLGNGMGVEMSCAGVGPDTMKAALALFDLQSHDVMLSAYTWTNVVENLKPGQLLVVAMIGTNSKGRIYQHNSIAAGVGEVTTDNGLVHKSVYFHDSYFYQNDKLAVTDQAYRDHVFFEYSPNIMDDQKSFTGKKFDIVGAWIVDSGQY